MALIIESTPRRADTPIVSDVAAGLSQLPYKFQRRDSTALSSVDEGGFMRINLSLPAPPEVEVGHQIYVGGVDLEIGLCRVTAVAGNQIDTDFVYIGNIGTNSYVNYITSRSDYLVLLDPIDALSGESYLPSPETYSPKQDGTLFVSVSNMLAVVVVDALTVNYRLRVQEYYNNIIASTQLDLAVFAMAAKKQLLDVGGSNMWEFLLNNSGTAEQMTRFKNPITWIGWQTNLYHIYDSALSIRTGATLIGFTFLALNINESFLGDVNNQIPIGLLPRIHTDIIPESLKIIENAYIVRVVLSNQSPISLSRDKDYLIKKPCENPIMLEWLNSNGVGEQWLFSTLQNVDNSANVGVIYEKPITDTLDVINETLSRISAGGYQRIVLFAEQLKPDQVQALHEIKESPYLYVWLDQTGTKKIKVIVDETFSTGFTTNQVLTDFSVQIRFPRNFNFYKNS